MTKQKNKNKQKNLKLSHYIYHSVQTKNWMLFSHFHSIFHILQLSSAERELKQKRFIAGPWELVKEFGHQEPGKLCDAVGIAINPTTQDVAVMDNKELQVKIYCNTGKFKFSSDTTKGLLPGKISHPWNVIVSSEGVYYITDATQFVRSYNQSSIYRKKWVAISPENKASDSEDTGIIGLAMDHTNNMLLVGEVVHKYISRHHLDGTHVDSFKVNIRPHFLSVTSQGAIIVNNPFTKVTKIIDTAGQVLHTLKPPSHVVDWLPTGVCCHERMLFICNFATPQDGIYCFSELGDFLGSIAVNRIPRCLTFVKEQKKFLLTSGDRVQVYSSTQ